MENELFKIIFYLCGATGISVAIYLWLRDTQDGGILSPKTQPTWVGEMANHCDDCYSPRRGYGEFFITKSLDGWFDLRMWTCSWCLAIKELKQQNRIDDHAAFWLREVKRTEGRDNTSQDEEVYPLLDEVKAMEREIYKRAREDVR